MKTLIPRITEVRPIPLRAPLGRPVRMALGEMRWRNGMLVEIETNAGVVGVGESWVNFPAWAAAERVATITQGLRPLLIGEPVDDPRRLHQKLVGTLHRMALQWGAVGPIYQAISGVDIALWDLAGKLAGVPIWQILGASRQESVPAYASGLGPDDPQEQAARAMADGFGAVKLKVGFGRDRDERNLEAVRAATGRLPLFTDANQGWNLTEARKMAPLLSAVGASWIEEPLPVDDPDWEELDSTFNVPVAGGENLYRQRDFARWGRDHLLVIQPDVCKCGGITAAHAILSEADPRAMLAPHYFGGAIGLVATIHLFAALPGNRRVRVEYDINPNPLRETLLTETLLDRGRLRVPDRPGLGVTLNASVVEQLSG